MANEKHSGSERGGAGNFANDPDKAREAGKKGGSQSHTGGNQSHSGSSHSGSQSHSGDQSSSGSQQSGSHSRGGQQGGEDMDTERSERGSGNFADDREKASEAGKKGGEHSHRGR